MNVAFIRSCSGEQTSARYVPCVKVPHAVLPRSLMLLPARLYGTVEAAWATACPTKNTTVCTQHAAPMATCRSAAAGNWRVIISTLRLYAPRR